MSTAITRRQRCTLLEEMPLPVSPGPSAAPGTPESFQHYSQPGGMGEARTGTPQLWALHGLV